jgi:hypothetical protein
MNSVWHEHHVLSAAQWIRWNSKDAALMEATVFSKEVAACNVEIAEAFSAAAAAFVASPLTFVTDAAAFKAVAASNIACWPLC